MEAMAKRQRAASPSPAVMAAMLRDGSYGRTMVRRRRWLRLQWSAAPSPTVIAEARRRHERDGDDVGEVKQAREDLTDFERSTYYKRRPPRCLPWQGVRLLKWGRLPKRRRLLIHDIASSFSSGASSFSNGASSSTVSPPPPQSALPHPRRRLLIHGVASSSFMTSPPPSPAAPPHQMALPPQVTSKIFSVPNGHGLPRDWFDISGIPMVLTGRLIGLYGVPFVSGDRVFVCGFVFTTGFRLGRDVWLFTSARQRFAQTVDDMQSTKIFARILTVNVDGDWITAGHLGN
nr:hypothetical protein Iba_chr05fCG6860 [Ipomoea batatas]